MLSGGFSGVPRSHSRHDGSLCRRHRSSLQGRARPNQEEEGRPPTHTMKVIATQKVPPKRVKVEHPVYEHEYAEIEKIVPVIETAQLTGRFTKVKDHVVVKSEQVGATTVEHLTPAKRKAVRRAAEAGPLSRGPDRRALVQGTAMPATRAWNGMHATMKRRRSCPPKPTSDQAQSMAPPTCDATRLPRIRPSAGPAAIVVITHMSTQATKSRRSISCAS